MSSAPIAPQDLNITLPIFTNAPPLLHEVAEGIRANPGFIKAQLYEKFGVVAGPSSKDRWFLGNPAMHRNWMVTMLFPEQGTEAPESLMSINVDTGQIVVHAGTGNLGIPPIYSGVLEAKNNEFLCPASVHTPFPGSPASAEQGPYLIVTFSSKV